MNQERRILIADDEPSILEICLRVTTELGFSVDIANDGAAAFSKVMQQEGRYEMVITDSKMPNMDGPELIHRIKRVYPKIDVIMMTGFPELEIAVEILKQGAYDYLLKPIDIDVLAACVNRCWEKRRIQGALTETDKVVAELRSENARLQELVKTLSSK